MAMTFRFRGPRAFYFARKRHRLDGLRSRMAEHRTCHPGGGGSWDGRTGDGEAWHKGGGRFCGWYRVRAIRGGQWDGPWRYRRDAPEPPHAPTAPRDAD